MREICEASLILFLLLSPSLFGCLWPAVNLLISLSSHSLSVQSTNTFSWLDLTCVICRVVSPRVRGHRTSVRLRDDRKVSESLLVLVGCQNMILTPFSSLIYYIRFSLLMLFLLLYLYLFFFLSSLFLLLFMSFFQPVSPWLSLPHGFRSSNSVTAGWQNWRWWCVCVCSLLPTREDWQRSGQCSGCDMYLSFFYFSFGHWTVMFSLSFIYFVFSLSAQFMMYAE